MTGQRFEEPVAESLDAVPAELVAYMDSVVVLVEDEPPAEDPTCSGCTRNAGVSTSRRM